MIWLLQAWGNERQKGVLVSWLILKYDEKVVAAKRDRFQYANFRAFNYLWPITLRKWEKDRERPIIMLLVYLLALSMNKILVWSLTYFFIFPLLVQQSFSIHFGKHWWTYLSEENCSHLFFFFFHPSNSCFQATEKKIRSVRCYLLHCFLAPTSTCTPWSWSPLSYKTS